MDEQIKSEIAQTEKDEAQEPNVMDEDAIMKKAYLKNKNLELIKKIEIDYCQSSYGNTFNAFNEVNLSPILKFESHILYHF